ncbi:hypothetical protein G4V62_18215 [Bacillaceae bacterium SIJ1]|uniref:hypothetical protein n=1 Tax=Litoribacterium kuwaitense TaxID=1398745 RepID=UPI0013EBA29C|nr:hypothetical protein [Litoribacterium kuwaitense]NGP46780.1 hypothetical protein [Litoribacterium kuwaitense]
MAFDSFFKLIFYIAVIFAVFSALLILMTPPGTVEFQLVLVTLVLNVALVVGVLLFSRFMKKRFAKKK